LWTLALHQKSHNNVGHNVSSHLSATGSQTRLGSPDSHVRIWWQLASNCTLHFGCINSKENTWKSWHLRWQVKYRNASHNTNRCYKRVNTYTWWKDSQLQGLGLNSTMSDRIPYWQGACARMWTGWKTWKKASS